MINMSDKKTIDAKKYSELSKIELSTKEMEILNEQFPEILKYFDLLSQVDISENTPKLNDIIISQITSLYCCNT